MQWQGGQALPMIIVFLVVLSAAFVFLFNSGQLLSERMKLSALADQVAHASAVQHARLLNLNAYLNRAAIANQLAVAQDVSIASWGMFVQPIPENGPVLLQPPITPIGVPIIQASKVVSAGMLPITEIMGAFIIQNELANVSIKAHQKVLNEIYAIKLLKETPKKVVSAAGLWDEGVRVRYLASTESLDDFIDYYSGDKRARLAPVLMDSRDPFTAGRKRMNKNLGIAKCKRWLPGVPFHELIKRGGTQLLGLDEWKGVDTFSLHSYIGYWKSRKHRLPKWVCRHQEQPVAYGSSVVFNDGGDLDSGDGGTFDGTWAANPAGSSRSNEKLTSWDSRRALMKAMAPAVPVFYDLTDSRRVHDRLELRLALKVYKSQKQLSVTSAASGLKVGDSLQQYERLPGKELSALARAAVYFERPSTAFLNSGRVERASLFNPYWRVRLEELTPEDRAAGAGL